MKKINKITALLLCAILFAMAATGCGKKVDPPNASTCTYDQMVEYLQSKGFIKKGTTPVDINTTEGYIKDNTGGEMKTATVADKANDYGGLWLLWWDLSNQESKDKFDNLSVNGGTIVIMGGAATLATETRNGAFALAFAEGYADKDAVVTAFDELASN